MKILDYQKEIISLLPPNVILQPYGGYCPVCFSNHIKPGNKTFAEIVGGKETWKIY